MTKDYTAHLINTHEQNWQRLAELEHHHKAVSRTERRTVEGEINQLCDGLAKELFHCGSHYLEATKLADKVWLRKAWERQTENQPSLAWTQIKDEWQLASLAEIFEQPQLSLTELPPLAFRISFKFTLAKPASLGETRPFFSRDEEALYVIDNPVRKDKTLQLPFLAPASYKGLLRSAARQVIGEPLSAERDPENPIFDNARIERLFGTDRRKNATELRRGRLWCFPTFFHEIGLKIINPHLRETGAGDKPILFETATGAGNFHLLYLPLDLTPTSFQEVAEDLCSVARIVQELFIAHGLGAKTSSGFGLTEDKLIGDGKIEIKAAGLPPQHEPSKPAVPETPLAGYLKAPGQLQDEFINDAGLLISEDDYKIRVERRGQQFSKKRGQDYARARKWWEREGQSSTSDEPILAVPVAKPPVAKWKFASLTKLVVEADRLAMALGQLAGGKR